MCVCVPSKRMKISGSHPTAANLTLPTTKQCLHSDDIPKKNAPSENQSAQWKTQNSRMLFSLISH